MSHLSQSFNNFVVQVRLDYARSRYRCDFQFIKNVDNKKVCAREFY